MKAMRLFLAADVDEGVRAWAAGVRRSVEQRARPAARSLRWVGREQMHLTLRFLGETAPAEARRLAEDVARGVPLEPFTFTLRGLDWFPPRGRPRVFVAAVGDGLVALRSLKEAIDRAIAGVAGPDRDDREFVAHLTLARVRDTGVPLVGAARQSVLDACGSVPALAVQVDHATLYASELSPAGPRYTVLATSPLRGTSS